MKFTFGSVYFSNASTNNQVKTVNNVRKLNYVPCKKLGGYVHRHLARMKPKIVFNNIYTINIFGR
jgi:hypothetical protein